MLLQLLDVRVEGDGEEGHVLADEDDVEEELTDQRWDVLQRLCEGDEQRIHPDPVVDVDVGERVSGHVVEEGQVQEATLFPVHFCVGEDEMQDSHEQNVRGLSKKWCLLIQCYDH